MATVIDRRSPKDFATDAAPWWCPGCGDFGVLRALQMAAAELNLDPAQTVLVAGIGCSGKIGDYFRSYSMHVVHGRTMPVATGIKLANRDLTVIAAGGDGDGYGIGLNHFIHAARRNVNITYIVMDNQVYGLTKGQTSPTTHFGAKTSTSPGGATDRPIKPLRMALVAGVTYLAQGFSGDPKHLAQLIKGAIQHRGFALVNCYSPCVTYNKFNTYDWYKERLINLDDDESYDPGNWQAALNTVIEKEDLVTGLIYRATDVPAFEDLLPGFGPEPVARQELQRDAAEWSKILAEFA